MIYPENGVRGSVEFMTSLPRMVGKWPKSKLIEFELIEFELIEFELIEFERIDRKIYERLVEFGR